ncbi:DegT/DnrJ/EryC1/StrS family aminotransferase [Paenibacillus polymyxa]|uniref:DegT/DnrJ/EryC1/StrS family aminotransferase n=1 Tax=Paenibacillus polymyxa TaxID=1406 RepID=UPI002AB437B0|nr:DegT/DnrJ/EryC1/StrS family aminotransferase [Paenibacillus polymyxa]MDY7991542.1 DegT/DnrJ/EryC1/StrS family aminotransferase [Paenibacillus polymyxa]MDY8117983.1 DegT/DnrJ/EryC1/StrS family aminotransferase [Paenibacillus polymyxa]
MMRIPFMKPNLVKNKEYNSYLNQIDDSRIYSNYGKLNTVFEEKILSQFYNGVGYVTTVNNATIGLMTSIMLSKKDSGRYAIMPSFTFSATAQAALWCGLEPYFVDIREEDWCLNEKLLAKHIEKLGEEVAIIVPYATFGTVVDLSYYQNLIDNGLPVVIDAAASFGSSYKGEGIESTFSGPIVYSFHATKSFGIGEGGLVYSKNKSFIKKVRQAGNFGFDTTRETVQIGLNSKMSEYSAAIGLATLSVFPEKKIIRQYIKEKYIVKMKKCGLLDNGWKVHQTRGEVAHQNVSVLCPKGCSGAVIVDLLNQLGVEARTYFSPACHQQSFFSKHPSSDLYVTEDVASRVVNLPLWEELQEEDIDYVVHALSNVDRKVKELSIYGA